MSCSIPEPDSKRSVSKLRRLVTASGYFPTRAFTGNYREILHTILIHYNFSSLLLRLPISFYLPFIPFSGEIAGHFLSKFRQRIHFRDNFCFIESVDLFF
ncbi:hypothetical protein V6N12_003460 [Hibiscus sabdariffa]|uniref:Uncharacterized protein n=1 Tax=Hibiscus sabdariffa TaxID=183260 RepID=A0ABR2AG80_9ROSI